ncbi:MAG: DNRLRE domain-containing protein [Oscillospiraceae bacterium]|jgi:hypothetical protein|nr:DNRLRE domain-containing protein [Oscillospiraceae bacterium]
MKKRIIAFTVIALLIFSAAACTVVKEDMIPATDSPPPDSGAPASGELKTEQWLAPDKTISASFSEALPDDSTGTAIDTEAIHVGQTADGKDIFAMLRLPLEGTWLAGEVSSARLFLKLKDGAEPASVRSGLVGTIWDLSFTTRAEARAAVLEDTLKTIDVKKEADGWFSLDVTDFVKSWLSGEVQNCGLAVFGLVPGQESSFVSADWADDDGNYGPFPYLEVSGKEGARDLSYGKFGYTETPLPGFAEDQGGNCLSYALRDTDMIFSDSLGVESGKLRESYESSGTDGVAEYTAELILAYVEAHKDALQISGFRRIDGFDAEIDAAKEYRIALRVGIQTDDEGNADFDYDGTFDYHLWAQLNDGQWAQKFPLDPSQIIPCSAPGLSPYKYPWDAALYWGMKFQNFYGSKTIYFAITKDTEEFTTHLSAAK